MTHQEKIKRAEQAKEGLKELFKENPELKDAFKEALEEMKKPENINTIANEITGVVTKIRELRGD